MVIISSSVLHCAQFYERPEDFSVVNAILRESQLAQSDVAKFKLIKLGPVQDVAAAAAGTYAMYQAGTTAYGLGKSAEQARQNTFIDAYLKTGLLGLLADKTVWAVAGALGAGYGAYQILYTRLERGIFEQVTTFVDMCENLDVYHYNFAGYPNALPTLGTLGKTQDGKPYASKWLQVNAAWSTSNIARNKGLVLLLLQANVATQLLAQIENTRQVQNLSSRITTIIQHLNNNASIIAQYAENEMRDRMQSINKNVQGAQLQAQLNLAQEQASSLWWAKVMLVPTAMSNLAKNTLKTLVYINDNKDKIITGAAITALTAYGAYAWIKAKVVGE
jgi:hypothetical protein